MARGMPAHEGDSCFAPNPPGLHTMSARSPCAAIRQCPVPTHPLSPVYPQLQAPSAERKAGTGGPFLLEGQEAWYRCWKELGYLEREANKGEVWLMFWTYRGWLFLSNQAVVREPAWGLSQLVDPEALPVPWVRAAQSLPSCVQEINSDTAPSSLPGFCRKQHGNWAENCHVLRARWQSVGRSGSSLDTKAGICPWPGHSRDVPDPFTLDTCVPQGIGKILENSGVRLACSSSEPRVT